MTVLVSKKPFGIIPKGSFLHNLLKRSDFFLLVRQVKDTSIDGGFDREALVLTATILT